MKLNLLESSNLGTDEREWVRWTRYLSAVSVSTVRPAAEGLVGLSSSADNDSSGIGTGAKSEYAFFLNRTVGGVSGENGLTSGSTGVKELEKKSENDRHSFA